MESARQFGHKKAFETLPDACMEPTATQRSSKPRNRAAKERQHFAPGAPTEISLGLIGALWGRPCVPKSFRKSPQPPQDAQKARQGSQNGPVFGKNAMSNPNRKIVKNHWFYSVCGLPGHTTKKFATLSTRHGRVLEVFSASAVH